MSADKDLTFEEILGACAKKTSKFTTIFSRSTRGIAISLYVQLRPESVFYGGNSGAKRTASKDCQVDGQIGVQENALPQISGTTREYHPGTFCDGVGRRRDSYTDRGTDVSPELRAELKKLAGQTPKWIRWFQRHGTSTLPEFSFTRANLEPSTPAFRFWGIQYFSPMFPQLAVDNGWTSGMGRLRSTTASGNCTGFRPDCAHTALTGSYWPFPGDQWK